MSALPLAPGDLEKLRQLIFDGSKIEAIKLYRNLTGTELVVAKRFVDELEASLRTQHPERFSEASAKGCGPALIFIGIIGLAAFWVIRRRFF